MILKINSDSLGMAAGTLCLIHCLATPFLFVAQVCSASCCDAAPTWWKFIDFLFLVISFFAVYQSTRVSSKNWVKTALWLSWGLLLLMILNENIHWFGWPEVLKYVSALVLIALHFYNLKFCKCENSACNQITCNNTIQTKDI